MRKAEGAEHYITAADTHWRSDAELRAVAEVCFPYIYVPVGGHNNN